MSQAGAVSSGGGGGGGIQTIDGDSGSVTGSTVSLTGLATGGGSVEFIGSGTVMTLNTSDGNGNTTIGTDTGTMNSGDYNTALGFATLSSVSGNYNTAIGYEAMQVVTGSDNVGIGREAFYFAMLSGNYNVGIGGTALNSLSTGDNNVAVGFAALGTANGPSNNVGIGYQAMPYLETGGNNIGIGYFSGSSYIGAESDNICIGNIGVLSETNTIHIGTQGSGDGEQNACYIAGIYGVTTLNPVTVTIDSVTGQLGSSSGGGSGIVTIDGDTGSATGSTISLNALNTGGSTASFQASGSAITLNLSDGSANTILGLDSGTFNTGTSNTCVGFSSMAMVGTSNNVVVGDSVFGQLTGSNNVAVGSQIGSGNPFSGNYNSTVGSFSLYVTTAGDNNTSIGYSNLSASTSGGNNTCLGSSSMTSLLTGTDNIAIGYLSGNAYTGSESSNLCCGSAGVVGESNTIHIGTQGTGTGQQNACYIAGIFGVTVGVSGTPVVIDNTGNLGTVVSSSRFKENITEIESGNLLNLRPVSFTYKSTADTSTHYGLIAEEVHEVFPGLVTYDTEDQPLTVKYHEMTALLLKEIQALNKRVRYLEGWRNE